VVSQSADLVAKIITAVLVEVEAAPTSKLDFDTVVARIGLEAAH
jgi:hypothetical protein